MNRNDFNGNRENETESLQLHCACSPQSLTSAQVNVEICKLNGCLEHTSLQMARHDDKVYLNSNSQLTHI